MQAGSVYLVRHGQAGSRQKYDELSELGREQAQLLGQYFQSNGYQFQSIVSGGLERQKETARIVAERLGIENIDIHPGWSEFDLDGIHRGFAPQLAAENPEFAAQYEALEREAGDAASTVHREWTMCDVMVFRAWREGRLPFDGESFPAFCARVRAARDLLVDLPKPALVISSATPIGLALGWAQGMNEMAAMRLAGEMWNSSWSEVRVETEIVLASFNNVAHLDREELKTLR